MQYRVCAVLVTFNRIELLKEGIQALSEQTRPLDRIFIINNNSTDGTKEYLDQLKNTNELIEPIHLDENLGGAGGFYYGTKVAYENDYDWIWIMDDDAEPAVDCLETLLLKAESFEGEIGFVSPLIIHKKTGVIQNYHHKRVNPSLTKDFPLSLEEINKNEVIEINANAFVGPLISKKVIEKVGLPRGDFFIWLDDTEYTHRISKVSKTLLITNAHIFHKDIDAKEDHARNFWKVCYGFRNRILWIKSSLKGNALNRSLVQMTLLYAKMHAKILIQKRWQKNRVLVLKQLNRAFFHGMGDKSGKFIDPVQYIKSVK
jgi:rhamnopyranosyl-N-acetylglucosaminyl-diphospho-decaprenol beta-1,3/1,4-galactofuranosyltransferase